MQEPNLDPVILIDLTKKEEESDLLSKFNTLQSHYDYLRTMLEIQGERSVQPYTWQINFDSVYFAVVPFWMPTKTIKINSCKLKIVGSNYRGYSGDVTVGGSGATGGPSPTSTGTPSNNTSGAQSQNHIHDCPTTSSGGTGSTGAGGTGSTSSAGSHTHSANVSSGFNTDTVDGHHHHHYRAAATTASGGAHTHTGPSHTHSGPSHTHAVGNTGSANQGHTHSLSSHTHSLNSHTHGIGTHDHGFTLSIVEGTDPTGVNVYIDNGAGYGSSIKSANSPVNIEMDIKEYISITQGWKKVKVTSTRLGRADITLILDVQINKVD